MRSDGKRCSNCERTLPFHDFAVRRASSDGRQNYCRSCHSAWTRSRRPRKLRDAPAVGPDEKWCRRCELVKPLSDFAANKSARDGLQGSCRACGAAAYRERRVSAGFHVRPGEIPLGHKYCRSCETVKPLSQWSQNVSASDGLQTRCRECASAAGRRDHLSRSYGMTIADVSELLAQQEGRCAICLVAEAIHIDHDHVDGRIRGMPASGAMRRWVSSVTTWTPFVGRRTTWRVVSSGCVASTLRSSRSSTRLSGSRLRPSGRRGHRSTSPSCDVSRCRADGPTGAWCPAVGSVPRSG